MFCPQAITVMLELTSSGTLMVVIWIKNLKIINVFFAYELEFIIERMSWIHFRTIIAVRRRWFTSWSARVKCFFHSLFCDWIQRVCAFLTKIEVIVALVFMDLAVLIAGKIINQILVRSLSSIFRLLT